MSDVHCRWGRFNPADMPPAEEIDAVIVAGDITNMGKPKGYRAGVSEDWEAAEEWLDALNKKYCDYNYFEAAKPVKCVYWIPGNHDINAGEDASFATYLAPYHFMRLNNGWRITGSSLCTAFDMPQLAVSWAHTTAHVGEDLQHWQKMPAADIVVSHCPPHGVLDGAGRTMNRQEHSDGSYTLTFSEERHIGSPGLLEYIHRHKPRLVVCGHCHEARGQQMVGETLVVNTAERWQVIEL